jgi:chemosensory pili system protein ChpA (sensor histidine kinase/response regulator)
VQREVVRQAQQFGQLADEGGVPQQVVVVDVRDLQALERLQEERPTVVLSDIEMPRMDGFDLARNIRADSALRDLPIIMITSRIAEKHREHAMELGVNHYLGKPYSDEELLSLIQHYARLAAATAKV